MPIIAYQSFNANSAIDHGVKSATFQKFTRDTNERVTKEGHRVLVLPYDARVETDDPNNERRLAVPHEGPAELKFIESLNGPQAINVFGAQIALLWQNFSRVFRAMPDIMVCGELDAGHSDFAKVVTWPDIVTSPVPATKACQSFTAFSQSAHSSKIKELARGQGFVAYDVMGIVVVFVHVPNSVASSAHETESFYTTIASVMKVKGNLIHLVLGDTNQPNFNYTARILNTAFKTDKYRNAGDEATVKKIDNYLVVEKGTNSTGTKMYDVAVYRSDFVELKKPTAYISQSSSAVTITDHCGLAVHVELKPTGS
jgi:hypothetical protein